MAVICTLDRRELQGNFQGLLFNFVILHSYILKRPPIICNTQNSNKMVLTEVQPPAAAFLPACSVSQILPMFTSHTDPLCQFTDSALYQYLFTSVLTAVMLHKHSPSSFIINATECSFFVLKDINALQAYILRVMPSRLSLRLQKRLKRVSQMRISL